DASTRLGPATTRDEATAQELKPRHDKHRCSTSAGGQHVAANVTGSVNLVRGADGNVKIKSNSSTAVPPAGAPTASYAPAAGNQSVTGSISGPVNLVDGAKDVELE
ncbi:hypothetical protein ACWGUN_32210, partial [Streptomyces koyangensis]